MQTPPSLTAAHQLFDLRRNRQAELSGFRQIGFGRGVVFPQGVKSGPLAERSVQGRRETDRGRHFPERAVEIVLLSQDRGQSAPAVQAPPVSDEVRMGTLVFHIARGELKRNNETIKLTERERDLLRQFALKRGVPIQRHELATDDTTGNDRAIDVQINRLRRKIETDPSNPVYLQTVRGKGYILYAD